VQTGCHLIAIWDHTDFTLSPGRGERTPPYPGQYRPVLDLPTSEGWKAELAWAHGCKQPCPTLKLSVADMDFACGRYGIGCGRCGLWPISSVADIVVADMVCGRYRRNSCRLPNNSGNTSDV